MAAQDGSAQVFIAKNGFLDGRPVSMPLDEHKSPRFTAPDAGLAIGADSLGVALPDAYQKYFRAILRRLDEGQLDRATTSASAVLKLMRGQAAVFDAMTPEMLLQALEAQRAGDVGPRPAHAHLEAAPRLEPSAVNQVGWGSFCRLHNLDPREIHRLKALATEICAAKDRGRAAVEMARAIITRAARPGFGQTIAFRKPGHLILAIRTAMTCIREQRPLTKPVTCLNMA
jgi:hypothetical protein